MAFNLKQKLYLIAALLLQATMVFASPNEANTSAAQSTSAGKAANTGRVLTLAECIRRLVENQTLPPTPNNVTALIEQDRPMQNDVADALREILPNYSWLIEPTDVSEYAKEPKNITEIVSKKHEHVTQYVLLVNPENGDWLWGLFLNVKLLSPTFRKQTQVPNGLVRLSSNVYFSPVSYFCQESQYGQKIWKIRRATFDGSNVTVVPLHRTRYSFSTGESLNRDAFSLVSRQTKPEPFGLILKYHPDYVQAQYHGEPDDDADLNSDQEEEEICYNPPWFLGAFKEIKSVLKKGGGLVVVSLKGILLPAGYSQTEVSDSYNGTQIDVLYKDSPCVVKVMRDGRPPRYYEFENHDLYLWERQRR